ncbi:hypothetical protein [Acidovorax sp. sic0104]|uniref:hypothetical protein n=1 Tax=Acidovorax sp. sic0104 TaxID=2854784 RepID=UPI001C44F1FD|nr:hypothetical protein [Acidovorax sp. sic0104]MBV7542219.1 hypothetical protein [Acidovorax sp. sic0104]
MKLTRQTTLVDSASGPAARALVGNRSLLRRAAMLRLQVAGALGALIFMGSNALAMSTAEICTFRGRFVESAALMRDAGKPQADALAEVKKAYRKEFRRDAPKSVSDYVAVAYDGKEFKPAELRQLVVSLCLQELK